MDPQPNPQLNGATLNSSKRGAGLSQKLKTRVILGTYLPTQTVILLPWIPMVRVIGMNPARTLLVNLLICQCRAPTNPLMTLHTTNQAPVILGIMGRRWGMGRVMARLINRKGRETRAIQLTRITGIQQPHGTQALVQTISLNTVHQKHIIHLMATPIKVKWFTTRRARTKASGALYPPRTVTVS